MATEHHPTPMVLRRRPITLRPLDMVHRKDPSLVVRPRYSGAAVVEDSPTRATVAAVGAARVNNPIRPTSAVAAAEDSPTAEAEDNLTTAAEDNPSAAAEDNPSAAAEGNLSAAAEDNPTAAAVLANPLCPTI